jgi:hypothetical protein
MTDLYRPDGEPFTDTSAGDPPEDPFTCPVCGHEFLLADVRGCIACIGSAGPCAPEEPVMYGCALDGRGL